MHHRDPEVGREKRQDIPVPFGLGYNIRIYGKPGLENLFLVPSLAAELKNDDKGGKDREYPGEIKKQLLLVCPFPVHA